MPGLRMIEPAFVSVIKRQFRDLKAFFSCDRCKGKTQEQDIFDEDEEEDNDMIYIQRATRTRR